MTTPKNTQPPAPASTDAAQRTDTQQAGKGMLDKTPQDGGPQVGRQITPGDGSTKASLAMPHERDQQTDMTPEKPAAEMKQASRDLKNGLKDTSKGTEMDQTYKKLRAAD